MSKKLLRFNKDLKYIVLDFETEGLNLRYSRPWQISWIVVEGGEVKREFDLFPDMPNINVSEGAAKVTGFNLQDYNSKKQNAKEALDLFESYLYNPNYLVVFHNGLGFDIFIHNSWRLNHGLKPDYSYMDRVMDTRCLSMAFKLGLKTPDCDLTQWQYKLLSFRQRGIKTNQKQMLIDFGIEFDENFLHNALYDVKMTGKLFDKLIWNLEI